MDDPRLRVCLERRLEVGGAALRLRDWPGLAGPVVHVADPLAQATDADARRVLTLLGAALPPRYRLLSLEPRGASPYQVDTLDLLGLLDQFGFATPILVGERLGCLPALLVAAWFPARVSGLVLIEPTRTAPSGAGIQARALRDCPPHWAALRAAVRCRILELAADHTALVPSMEAYLTRLGLAD